MGPCRDDKSTDENLDHLEMATMSDKPMGPGWWQASDGTWHPPELHPSMQGEAPSSAQTSTLSTLATTDAVAVPTADPVQIAPMPSMESVAQVAPVAQAVPDPQVAPVAAVPSPVPAQAVAEAPVHTPVATVAMPGFGQVPPQPVPSLADVQAQPSWSGESDLRPSAGPMFPDMFQQAVADSHLVSAVAVNYGDGEHHSLDGMPPAGQVNDTQLLEASPFRMPAEIGAFTGASAKKRRWHH